MPDKIQILRFAVGASGGARSRAWRLWVPKQKSDVYVSGRTLGGAIKVSLHEPGPARYALTGEYVRRKKFQAPAGKDPRLAIEWNRPRPAFPNRIARPLTIIVPSDEVRVRERPESGEVCWIAPPPDGMAIHFDIVYTPAGVEVEGHPGARSMGTTLVGVAFLQNTERVFVTASARPIQESLRQHIAKLRSARIRYADGRPYEKKIGLLAFGTEPNADARDGTDVGILLDVTPCVKDGMHAGGNATT